MSAFPDGYTCGQCGQFVGWNTGHTCGGMKITATLPSAEHRIAAALERIAGALEARADGA